ncbi:MAG: allantoinase AllB [Jatrophihabitans sp.]
MQHLPDSVAAAELVLRGSRVLTPSGERAAVVAVRAGRISAVHPVGDPAADTALASAHSTVELAPDCVLLPGLVDSHVHVNEPGRTDWEGFATATAAAAAGGITTLADMPLNCIPATVNLDALELKKAAATGQLAIDVAFWGGAVPGNRDELQALHEAGVVGFKCFLLDSGVPEFPALNGAQLRAAMSVIATFDGLLCVHAEDAATIEAAVAPTGREYAQFLKSRPDQAELVAIADLIVAVELTGCRTHIVHLSSATALPMIARAKAAGLPLTVETCPHYLALSAEQVPAGATEFKCCPPIRSAANQELLWQGLAEGVIDSIVSDHSPCPIAAKRSGTGDCSAAWGGIASIQLGLPVVWRAAAARGLSLAEVARWMALAPARLLNLPDRGEIAPGFRADLCVLAPEEVFVVEPGMLRQRSPLTPYLGSELLGVVRQTWLRGELVLPDSRAGQFVLGGR